MILDRGTALKTAELLLQIKALKLQPDDPFTWASGWKSPIYCDNRITLSYPAVRNYLREHLSKQIENEYGKPDAIVGVATGAIGIGMLVADYLNLPFAYVRPKPKAHGRQNQIEGHLEPNSNVIVIEDLISTGGSSLQAVQALRDNGISVKAMFALFTYGFQIADDNFEKAGVTLHTLSNYEHLLEQGLQEERFDKQILEVLRDWRTSPSTWNK